MKRRVVAGAWMAGAVATATLTALATYSGPWKTPPDPLDDIAERSAALGALSQRARSESETVKNAPNPDFDGLTQIVREIETQSDGLRQMPTSGLDKAMRLQGRMRAGIMNAIDGRSVATAVEAVREALAAMAGSTATTLSGHFDAFATAVEALIALSETGIELGITGTGEVDPHDPWKAYGAELPTPKR